MPERERLDKRVVELGLSDSRTGAQALILSGQVLINGHQANKASDLVGASDAISVREKFPFVSRGGLKLEKAFSVFKIDVTDRVCLDVGASTGGFTDCLLQHGAKRVYAVDVGHGQLDYRLRQNPAVVVMERYNARNLNVADIETVSFACADVSFISLKHILLPMYRCLEPGGEAVVLIKPQFEAGKENVQKGGVIRDPGVRKLVCIDIMKFSQSCGYGVRGLDVSPIKGPKGNAEYLLWLGTDSPEQEEDRLTLWAQEAVSDK